MKAAVQFKPGNLVRARGREWVVLPELRSDLLKLRPLGGAEDDATLLYLPLEPEAPEAATFDPPNPDKPGSQEAALLLRDALRLKLRAGAGPFRSFGNLNVEPRTYQLVPLLMALRQNTIRLLIADDVGIGKTIEAGLIARELIDRGEIERLTVICPPHLCEQWQQELAEKFSIDAKVVRTGTVRRLERGLRPDESIFEVYPYTVVSLDYIKSDRRRHDFLRTCPGFVIVDEAHTCVRSNTDTRHQRYQLIEGLAKHEPRRSIVFLTATPHSGDDTAFHNLLGLLEPRFAQLAEMLKGNERSALRKELANHFVQRRRGDIAQWEDEVGFPTRESREATYRLSGDWGQLFDEVLAYARQMVQRAEGGSRLEQRMSWWAALALLRCVSSSPAAASLALRTRLRATEGETEQARVANLNQVARKTVMDEAIDDSLAIDESVPPGTVDHPAGDVAALHQLIARAEALRGPKQDPKLRAVIREVRRLLKAGYEPVVFCRYIATAQYVGDELRAALSEKSTHVEVVTGALTPDRRKECVEAFGELGQRIAPVLVATDCLSEGINLQNHFNAVVHYDLTWNPTRHEQREGRVDRFGQTRPTVRALMLYGKDNPVDGAVLRVILRKAEKIRQELGVAVPLPTDNDKVVDAIMKAVLLQRTAETRIRQEVLDFGDEEDEVEHAWKAASDKVKGTRTIFAQRRLRPDDVIPEWRKAVSVLGGSDDVERFVRLAAQRLGAPLDPGNGYSLLPVKHLPKPLQERLDAVEFKPTTRIAFAQPVSAGTVHVHRVHPLVSTLADYVAEQALDADRPEIGARASAMFTAGVKTRTVLYLLRLRSQIQIRQRGKDGRYTQKSLLAEECLGVAVRGRTPPGYCLGGNASGAPVRTAEPRPLTEDDALSLLSLEPGRNMEDSQKSHLIREAIKSISKLEGAFEHVAQERARALLADHKRIREASEARGLRYSVIPALPVDKIGVYVFLPMANL